MNNEMKPYGHAKVSSWRDKQKGREIENKLQESEERYRIMFEQAAVGMAHVGLDGRWLYVNQKLCDITGYTYKELQEKTFQEITHPTDLVTNLAHLERLLSGEIQTYSMEKRYFRKDQSLAWINLTASLIRDSLGVPLYFVSVIEDINERKLVEEKLIDQAAQLGAILDALADAMIVFDRNGHILYASSVAQEFFSFEVRPDHTVSANDLQTLQYPLRSEFGEPLSHEQTPLQRILRGEILKGANIMEVLMQGRHGRDMLLSMSGAPMWDTEGRITGGVLVARDVTEGRGLERRTHTALQGLLAMAEALVSLPEDSTDADTVGQQLAELTRNVLDCQCVWMYIVEPETEILRPFVAVGLTSEQGISWREEERQRNISLHDTVMLNLLEDLNNSGVLVLDVRQSPFDQLKNRHNVRKMVVAPMCIGERLIGIVNLGYDDVDRLYTESERALAGAVAKLSALVIERQRLLAERAEAQGREVALSEANRRMEEFLGLASHELRTPLTTIKANIQLAMRRLKSIIQQVTPQPGDILSKVDVAQGMLTRAERQVGVLNRLVSDMIDISHIQSGRSQLQVREEPGDLVSIVRKAIQEQQKALPSRMINAASFPNTPVPVLVDSDRIAQVVNNYLNNALKYSSADKPVSVSLTVEGSNARVVVRDYGQGLSDEDQQLVWECFYQSPKVKILSGSGVGLGLGLYLNRTLIEHHRGHVGVESTLGEGSAFWFTLPLLAYDTSELR